MADAELRIKIPTFDFDIIQGQDLILPIEYAVDGIDDTMAGAYLKMALVNMDWSGPVDELSMANGRMVVSGVNKFNIIFMAGTTSGYSVDRNKSEVFYRYGVELTSSALGELRIFEGIITCKREQVK